MRRNVNGAEYFPLLNPLCLLKWGEKYNLSNNSLTILSIDDTSSATFTWDATNGVVGSN